MKTVSEIVNEIKNDLEGVTPGPWFSAELQLPPSVMPVPVAFLQGPPRVVQDRDASGFRPADAAHIARCSPDNIAIILNALSEATSRGEALEALKVAQTAISDWTCLYAPDECSEISVAEARARTSEHGTLWYLAHVADVIRSARISGEQP